jgi:lipoprotein Spr
MVGIKCEEMANIQLYKFIDKWYGTDYRLGGQSERGIDCSGFTQKLYGEVYSTELTRTAQDQYRNAERSKHSEEAEEGDLVFFKQRGKRITHVGVYLANDFFVHSSTSSGVVISNLNEDYWRKHYVGIGKIQKGEKPTTITSAEEETQAAH